MCMNVCPSKNTLFYKRMYKFFLIIFFIYISGKHQYKEEHCIKMTPEKDKEVGIMVEKITAFLERLAIEHEDFDIRFANFDIEGHASDEGEKDTVLQVNINDCVTAAENKVEEELIELDIREEVNKNPEEEIDEEPQLEKNDENVPDNEQVDEKESEKTPVPKCDIVASNEPASETKMINTHPGREVQKALAWKSDGSKNIPRGKPTVAYVRLSDKERKIIEILEKKQGKRPIIMVLDKDGTRNIILPHDD